MSVFHLDRVGPTHSTCPDDPEMPADLNAELDPELYLDSAFGPLVDLGAVLGAPLDLDQPL